VGGEEGWKEGEVEGLGVGGEEGWKEGGVEGLGVGPEVGGIRVGANEGGGAVGSRVGGAGVGDTEASIFFIVLPYTVGLLSQVEELVEIVNQPLGVGSEQTPRVVPKAIPS
jgi:hypothetical protein